MTDLEAFLATHQPLSEETAIWGDGQIHLRITGYLTADLPPIEYVTSVRAVVFWNDHLLAFRGRHGVHILPGGRREAGESLEETLVRELLEETGWRITDAAPLGFVDFRHLTPKPPGYPYPYPDFLQIVSLAQAVEFVPTAKTADEFVDESFFHPLSQSHTLALAPNERLFLDAAVSLRRKRSAKE